MDYVDNLGVPVLLHCCGNLRDYIDDLAQTKISAVHPLTAHCRLGFEVVQRKVWSPLCHHRKYRFISDASFGTPEDVAQETMSAIDSAGLGGGYVLASDHSLHDGIPIENILEMFRVGAEYEWTILQGM